MKEVKKNVLKSLIIAVLILLTLYFISASGVFSGSAIKTTKCYDTDQTSQHKEGRNHFVRGTVSGTDAFGNSFSKTDSCLGNYLRESWCDKNGMRFEFRNFMRSELKLCEKGCFDGACKK